MQQYKKEFIEFMVECGVLTFGDFTTKSGRKTPFFINASNYRRGNQLKRLGEFYAKAIKEKFDLKFDFLYGPAYKGIPLAVTTAIAISNLYNVEVEYSSNRKEVKDHGDKGILLGGKPKSGSKVLVIEDVTTAGTSIYENMPILKAQGDVSVVGLIISVDRMEKGKTEISAIDQLEQEFGFKIASIVNMNEVVECLYNKEVNGKVYIDDKMKESIDAYYKIYGVKK